MVVQLFKKPDLSEAYVFAGGEKIAIPTTDLDLIEELKRRVPGLKKDRATQHQLVPIYSEYVDAIRQLGINLSTDAKKHVFRLKEKEDRLEALSKAEDAELILPGFGFEPRNYQRAGIAYGLEQKRVIIGDDMGLGKTIQALGIIYGADAFPALIVAPYSNADHWADVEAPIAFPDKFICRATKKTSPMELDAADVIITHYEQLLGCQTWKDEEGKQRRSSWYDAKQTKVILSPMARHLQQMGLRSITLDEGHAISNTSTAQAHACMELRLFTEYRMILSGTPMKNRTSELYSMLKFMDMVDLFGGFFHFMQYFCGMQTQKKAQFGPMAPENWDSDELHRKMRRTMYVRRKKTDVMKHLPPKTRTSYHVEIDNRKDYDRAENELVEWVQERVLKNKDFMNEVKQLPPEERQAAIRERQREKATAAENAEVMVKISALRQVTAEGKIKSAIEWIDNFHRENPEEKLIVFGMHKTPLEALLKRYPDAARVISADDAKTRQKNVKRFQTASVEDCWLMVGAMGTNINKSPAGVGHTMTAACYEFFLELGWNNAHTDQCEDRAWRDGQKNAVFINYWLGKNTIDEKLASMIEAKRAVSARVIDGDDGPITDGILAELVDWLIAKAA